jgi:hypothetical protein
MDAYVGQMEERSDSVSAFGYPAYCSVLHRSLLRFAIDKWENYTCDHYDIVHSATCTAQCEMQRKAKFSIARDVIVRVSITKKTLYGSKLRTVVR